MKGNEARVVFFLHPVDQVKDGKVAKVEPLKNSVGIISLLVLALLFGLGVLIYLCIDLESDPSQLELVSLTENSSTTNEDWKDWKKWEDWEEWEEWEAWEDWEEGNNEPVTTGSTEVTSERPRENNSTTESGPFPPGKIL